MIWWSDKLKGILVCIEVRLGDENWEGTCLYNSEIFGGNKGKSNTGEVER